MFFSIPYSTGFTATVNGEKTEVEKVDFGLTAVRVPALYHCDIVFHYETPGLKYGQLLTIGAAAAFIIYLSVVTIFRLTRRQRHAV